MSAADPFHGITKETVRGVRKAAAKIFKRDDEIEDGDRGEGMTLVIGAESRLEYITYRDWKGDDDLAAMEESFDNIHDSRVAYAVPYLRCVFRKGEGNKLFAAGKYEEAIEMYLHAMRALVGEEFELPTKVYFHETYKKLLERLDSYKEVVDLAACGTNIAQCYIKMKQYAKVCTNI